VSISFHLQHINSSRLFQFADNVHSFSDSQRRLMLLPVMILMGSRILGWDVVDMEIVMHVGLVDLTSLSFQNTLRVRFALPSSINLASHCFFVAL
jgi:hypothetical protein